MLTCREREWKNSAPSRPSPPFPVVPPLVRARKLLLQELKALALQQIPMDRRRGSAGKRITCLGRRFKEGWWRLLESGLEERGRAKCGGNGNEHFDGGFDASRFKMRGWFFFRCGVGGYEDVLGRQTTITCRQLI
jgi:hypothetical protein